MPTSFDLGSHPPSDTLRYVARYFDRLCAANTPDLPLDGSSDEPPRADPALHCTPFHARAAPTIELQAYLARILKYCPCANEVFIALVVYTKRLADKGITTVDRFNIHRLCISGVVVASKYFSDVFFTNSRYAKVGGLPVLELNALEIKFMEMLDYRMHITNQHLQEMGEFLWEYRPRPSSIMVPLPGPPPSQPPTPSQPIDISQMAWRPQAETPVSATGPFSFFGGHTRPQSAGGLQTTITAETSTFNSPTAVLQQNQPLPFYQHRRPRTSGHQRAMSYHPAVPITHNHAPSTGAASMSGAGATAGGTVNSLVVQPMNSAGSGWVPSHRWSSTEDYILAYNKPGRVTPDAPVVSRHRASSSVSSYHNQQPSPKSPSQYNGGAGGGNLVHPSFNTTRPQRSRSYQQANQPLPTPRTSKHSLISANGKSPSSMKSAAFFNNDSPPPSSNRHSRYSTDNSPSSSSRISHLQQQQPPPSQQVQQQPSMQQQQVQAQQKDDWVKRPVPVSVRQVNGI